MTLSRVASLVVAAAYLVAVGLIVPRDALAVVVCVLISVLPLPFIWFPEAIGNYTGPAHLGFVNRPTAGLAVAVAGWVVLALVPPVVIALHS